GHPAPVCRDAPRSGERPCGDLLCGVGPRRGRRRRGAPRGRGGRRPERRGAAGAKAEGSDAARKVGGEAIQVHGGIGFTWEYDLHLYFKRAKTLETSWGDADYHRELIVRQVAG